MKIAVVENSNGETCSIFEPGFIAVYEEDGGQWKSLSRFENTVCEASGIAAVHRALADTVKNLDGLKTVVASEISGVAFSLFEAAKCGSGRVERFGDVQPSSKFARIVRPLKDDA